MLLVERIKMLCKESGITLAELERLVGIGNGIIARWKKSSPKADSLKKVADHFGVSTDYLLGLTEHRSPNEVFAASSPTPYEELPPEVLEKLESYKLYLLEEYRKSKKE